MSEEQPWMAELKAQIRVWKTSDLLRGMAYCEAHRSDPRLEWRARFIADEIDRRFPSV